MNRTRYFLVVLIMICIANTAYSQYYYNDIIATHQSQQQYLALKKNRVAHVTASSYESDNQPTENFKLEQVIGDNARIITINASYPSTGYLTSVNTYKNQRLVSTRDSTANVITITTYTYDAAGNISTITTKSDDAFMNSHSTETHEWVYTNGQPAQMLKIKDNADTTTVVLTYQDSVVAKETWKRKGAVTENYYYYYNANKQLTDVVRYNVRVKKMLPDYLYDYDTEGHIIGMTQVPTGSADYMIWKYSYNSKGLKEKELLYNKQQQLVGRIEYKYE